MAGPLQALEQGTYNPAPGAGQKLWWSYYDSFIMAAATTENRMFTIPLGQGGKNLSDTNLLAAGQIPQGQRLVIKAIEMYYISNATKSQAAWQNLIAMFRDTTGVFNISGKSQQLELNITQLMGNPIQGIITNVTADMMTSRSSYTGVWELPVPIVLAAQTVFDFTVTHHTAANATLDGDIFFISLVGSLVTLQ